MSISKFFWWLFTWPFKGVWRSISRALPTKRNNEIRSFTNETDETKVNEFGNPFPIEMHTVLDSSKRTIVIGDVHGCLDELRLLLEKTKYSQESCNLIFVGDLVNKGPYSAETVKFVREIGGISVRGDLSVLNAKNKSSGDFVADLSSEDVAWLQQLPYSISLPHFGARVCHAGRVQGLSLAQQSPAEFVNMRNIVAGPGGLKGSPSAREGQAWTDFWKGPEHVIYGHDAVRGLQLRAHSSGLDTGACYGRKLTALVLPAREIVQVDALRIYQKP